MALTRQISHEPPQIPSRSGRQFRSYTRRTQPDFPPLLAATKPATLAEIFASMKDWMNL
jgi:hypothetical protein